MFYFYLFNCIFASDTMLPLDLCLLNVQDTNNNIFNFIVFKHNSKIIEEITGEKTKIGKCLYRTTNGYLIDKRYVNSILTLMNLLYLFLEARKILTL